MPVMMQNTVLCVHILILLGSGFSASSEPATASGAPRHIPPGEHWHGLTGGWPMHGSASGLPRGRCRAACQGPAACTYLDGDRLTSHLRSSRLSSVCGS